MYVGSLVKCIYNFDVERRLHQHKYPHKGDILTISKIDRMGAEKVLWFRELAIKIPLAAERFQEIQNPGEGNEIIYEVIKILENNFE